MLSSCLHAFSQEVMPFDNAVTRNTYKVTGIVFHKKDKKAREGVNVFIYKVIKDENNKINYVIDDDSYLKVTNKDGMFSLIFYTNTEYLIECYKPGYTTLPKHINTEHITSSEHISIEIELVKLTQPVWQIALSDEQSNELIPEGLINIVDVNSNILRVIKLDKRRAVLSLSNADNYTLQAKGKNYLNSDIYLFNEIGKRKGALRYVVIKMKKVEVGKKIMTETSFYDPNEIIINKKGEKSFKKIYDFLVRNPHIKVEIGVHTDARGDDNYNLNLSCQRAEAMLKRLIEMGIGQARLVAKGYGEKNLLNECSNRVKCEYGQHEKNRRIEITILGLIDEVDR